MLPLRRADLINGSLVLLLAIQSATSFFCVVHRALGLPLATSGGTFAVEVPWLFIGLAVAVTAIGALLVRRFVVRTSGPSATTTHAISAKLWLAGYSATTALLSIYYLGTFTSVFHS